MNRTLRQVTDQTAVLIFTPINRRYLTGFSSSLGYLLLTKGENILFVDGRYYEAAQKRAVGVRIERAEKVYSQIDNALKKAGVTKLLIETENEISLLTELRSKLDVRVSASKPLSDRLLAMRSVKTKAEIDSIVASQRITEKAFFDILNYIKPGVTEKQIAALLEYKMKLYGAEGIAFETIAVSGSNSSMPHGVPTDKPVEAGDFITMDFGAQYNGYCSDMTRTVAVGQVSDEMALVYDTVLKAQKAAELAVKAGADCADVDAAARQMIEQAGYGANFNHSTGHGVGLYIHEMPNLSPRAQNTRLRAKQIVTDEPGIYLPGKFGVRIEDMLLVTKNGCKNLTKAPKDLIIL